MHLYLAVPLAACVASAILAAVILVRDPGDRAHRIAAVLLACSAFWAFCEVLWHAQTGPAAALAWVKLSALGWVAIGPLALHLFVEIVGEPAPRTRRALPFLYAASGGFLVLDWGTSLVHPGVVRESWGWAYELGPAYLAFYVFAVGCILAALRLGWRTYAGSASPGERAQARWLGGGILVPLAVASLTDGLLPWAGVQWPRFGTASLAVLGATIAWSFHRYGYSLLAPGTFAGEILEALPDGIAMLRSDGRIRRVNGPFARLLGADPADLVGVPAAELLAGCDGSPADELRDVPCELRERDGSRTPVSISTMPLRDRQGAPIGTVLFARDIREVVALRSRLALSGRLAAVGELAAGIAHEINNPLAYVKTNLSLLRSHWHALSGALQKASADPPLASLLTDGEEMIDESLEGVERATAIVRDVRGLAHAGGGERQSAHLPELLDGVLRMVAPQLPAGTRVETAYGDVPPIVCAPQELQQVFLNLVLNAGQALRSGGSIHLETRADGPDIIVCVRDDGCGIEPAVASRIFDPFFTTKPVGEGTGLGLPIAYEIVRRHRGEIRVESEPGRGTCFRVQLPIAADRLHA